MVGFPSVSEDTTDRYPRTGVGFQPLGQWFSKCGPHSTSTWNLLECKLSGPTPHPVKSEAGGLEELRSPPRDHSSTEPVCLSFVLPCVLPRGWFRGFLGQEMGSRIWGQEPASPPTGMAAACAQLYGGCLHACITLG